MLTLDSLISINELHIINTSFNSSKSLSPPSLKPINKFKNKEKGGGRKGGGGQFCLFLCPVHRSRRKMKLQHQKFYAAHVCLLLMHQQSVEHQNLIT